jgi:hypothetical protein
MVRGTISLAVSMSLEVDKPLRIEQPAALTTEYASVAQWIEQLRPKEKMGVRFPLGAQSKCLCFVRAASMFLEHVGLPGNAKEPA